MRSRVNSVGGRRGLIPDHLSQFAHDDDVTGVRWICQRGDARFV